MSGVIPLLVRQVIVNFNYFVLVIFLFFTFAFPKAGTKVTGIPLYVSTILGIFIGMYLFVKMARIRVGDFKRMIYFLLLFSSFLSMIVNFLIAVNDDIAFGDFISGISAFISIFFLVFAFFQSIFRLSVSVWKKLLVMSFVILTCYGLIQKILGDYNVVIPGLTAAYSEAIKPNFLEYKCNAIRGINYIKLTSTYQNGNLFGVNYILISWWALYFLKDKKILFWLSLLLYIVICLLTASATVIIGMVFSIILFMFYHVKTKLSLSKIIAFLSMGGFILLCLICVFHLPLLSLIIKTRLIDRPLLNGGGRVQPFLDYIQNIDCIHFLFGGFLSKVPGGAYEMLLPSMFYYFGIIVVFLFVIYVFLFVKEFPLDIYTIGIYSFLISSLSDAGFWLPPTAVNFSLLLGLAYYFSKTRLESFDLRCCKSDNAKNEV